MPDQANNVTPHQAPTGYLSDPFDKTAVWEEQCCPLVQQLFDVCKEHDIAFHLVALYGFEHCEDGSGVECRQARAFHLPGPHRVPHMFAMAARLFEDPEYYQFAESFSQLYAAKLVGGDMEG